MDRNCHARDAQRRAIRVYTQRPDKARAHTKGTAQVLDGLGCRYEEEGTEIAIDMPFAIGGQNEGPSPGFFGRAALSSCVAIGIKMMATREDIALDQVNVRIDQDWDNRGVLAVGGAETVARASTLVIDLLGPASKEALTHLVSRALEVDPWFLAYRDAQPLDVSVCVAEGAV